MKKRKYERGSRYISSRSNNPDGVVSRNRESPTDDLSKVARLQHEGNDRLSLIAQDGVEEVRRRKKEILSALESNVKEDQNGR